MDGERRGGDAAARHARRRRPHLRPARPRAHGPRAPRVKRGLALLGLAAALAGGCAAAGATAATPASRPALIAAHRGGAALWPENSLLPFRNALGLGVDFLETDVHLTADGEVVILHDPTLDRTTTARGRVADVRLGDLAGVRLNTADARVTDEPIPTLAGLLDLLVPPRATLLLELKVDAADARYPRIEEKVLALVKSRGLAERTVIMAFQPATIRRVRELERAMRTALLVGRRQVPREGMSPAELVARARAAAATHLGLDHRRIDAAVVAAARAAGLGLGAWTVNTEADLCRVIALGVDVVISDCPDLAKRLAGR